MPKNTGLNSVVARYQYWIIFLLIALTASWVLIEKIQRLYEEEIIQLNTSQAAPNTALRLNPTSGTIRANQNFSVDINLDTGGDAIDGIDIFYLRFNPSILQVVDADTAASGVQISPGTTLPLTLANSVNNTAGTIQFSQTTSGGTTFNGTGRVATVTFRAIANGSSSPAFDFTLNATTDTNVSSGGTDRLSIVQGGTYTADITAPTVSITAPATGATVSGNVAVTATATDSGGVAGVQFLVDGNNIGSEDTSSPYSVTWNSTTATNGSHTLTAVARDVAGNTTTSNSVNVTVSNDTTPPTVSVTAPANSATVSGTTTVTASASDNVGVVGVQFRVDGQSIGSEDTTSPYSVSWDTTTIANGSRSITAVARDAAGLSTTSSAVSVTVLNPVQKTTMITLSFEGRSSRVSTGTLSLLSSSKAVLNNYNFTTNSSGQASITMSALPQQVYLKVAVPGFLTRLLGPYDYNTLSTGHTFPILRAGDFTGDNIVNSVDFSYMNARWFGNDPLADINQDGLINTIDFSLMNGNWFATGEQ